MWTPRRGNPELYGLIKRLLLTAVCALFLVLTLLCQGLPWYRVHQSEAYVGKTLRAGFIGDEKAWSRRYGELLRTIQITRLDGEAYWALGEMHHLRAADLRLWPDRQREEWEAAKRYYFSALVRSPDNGVLIARVSSRLALAGDRRAVALMRRALELAPYEPAAQYPLAETGMLFWDELDPDLKEAFKAMIARAMKDSATRAAIANLARMNKWSSVLETL